MLFSWSGVVLSAQGDVFQLRLSINLPSIISSNAPTHEEPSSMAFRKRNIALSRAPSSTDATEASSSHLTTAPPAPVPGVRPSPIDGRPTTSTGTPSLDGILAGHAGLPLGHSILIEDYAGALLRFYAAEGVVQGHQVHVVGMGEVWGRELPGISEDRGSSSRREGKERAEKMKIAWRYEGLGQFESSRGASCVYTLRMPMFIVQDPDNVPGRCPVPEQNSRAKRQRGGGDFDILSHVRPRETPHVAHRDCDQLYHDTSYKHRLAISPIADLAQLTKAAHFVASKHRASPCNTLLAFTRAISRLCCEPNLDTAVLA
jgi:hypothetical protein